MLKRKEKCGMNMEEDNGSIDEEEKCGMNMEGDNSSIDEEKI